MIAFRVIAVVVILICASPVFAAPPANVSIVVNLGEHASAEAAGNGEAAVNWLDEDQRDDAICTEAYAALELRKYLRLMTGRENDFEIFDDDAPPAGELILVGSPADNATAAKLTAELGISAREIEQLGAEGYRIKTGRADGWQVTLIAGGSRVGTLFGAYDLLHRMGCRWFSPAEFDEDVPRADWNPAFDATERPDFELRGFRIPQKRGGPPIYHWIARNRLNLWRLDRDNEPLQRKLGIGKLSCGGHYTQEKFLNPLAEYPYDHSRFAGDDGKPPDPWPTSESFRGDGDSDGKLSYFEAHPEWFPLLAGRRVCNDVHRFGSANFCTSNEAAVAEYLNNFVREFVAGEYRGATVVEAWTIDGGRWCQCPRCQSLGSPTDRYLRLVYQLDKSLKQARRKGLISHPVDIHFLIYRDVLAPPTRPLPDDFDYHACIGQFFPIRRCYVHKFNDPSCERNAHYLKILQGWISEPDRHYRGRISLGEYYDYSRFENLPACYMNVMAADIPFYRSIGASRFHYHHTPTGRWGSKSLTAWQMARQTWDADADCRLLWDDYFARRYGPAAGAMRSYYESLELMLGNVQLLKGWSPSLCTRLERGQKPLFPDPHMRRNRESGMKCLGPTFDEMLECGKQCRNLIAAAAAMPLSEQVKARLEEDERLFTYAQQTLHYYDQCAQAYELAWAGRTDEAKQRLKAARCVADLLRQDDWPVSPEYTYHDKPPAENALTATNAAAALERLAKLLESPPDAK